MLLGNINILKILFITIIINILVYVILNPSSGLQVSHNVTSVT